MSKLSVTTKLIKNLYVIASNTREYIYLYSISGFYKKPCAMSLALYLTISFFSLSFRTITILYPTSNTPSGAWTAGPNTSRFANEFNYT
jgi:hypothetical protein